MRGNMNLVIQRIPFLKLLTAFACGVLLHWYASPGKILYCVLLVTGISLIVSLFFIPRFDRYRLNIIPVLASYIIFFSLGGYITWKKDCRNDPDWVGKHYRDNDAVCAVLMEPLSERPKSWKAKARVQFMIRDGEKIPVTGRMLIYFRKQKDDSPQIKYGTQLIFTASLQEIKNSGNPGGFDYRRYCFFQGITHQVFLDSNTFYSSPLLRKKTLKEFLLNARMKIIDILRNNIKGNKELGLAEALLIGYKDDLDPELTQSYTNTGVVHIIAISGLHLGLIYGLLIFLCKPLRRKKRNNWMAAMIVVLGLWLFSLMAGAQPSILRSALMFTGIAIGEQLDRKNSVYNTMAISAFILLCINPFWLWDIGFQLSYSAVLSILIFMRPVYNCFFIKNKYIDLLWKLNATTIAAQFLTLPICLYHFHQFPNYFLLTNLIAVPLSSLILLIEIALFSFSFLPILAKWLGIATGFLITCMNRYIEFIESLPGSIWQGIQIDLFQTLLSMFFIIFLSYGLFEKRRIAIYVSLCCLLFFSLIRSGIVTQAGKQNMLIIYNVPRMSAIQVSHGRRSQFIGNDTRPEDKNTWRYTFQPALSYFHFTDGIVHFDKIKFFSIGNRKFLIIDETPRFKKSIPKTHIDFLILSKNPRLYFDQLTEMIDPGFVIFDSSVPSWKLRYWKKDCDSLHIPYHDVTQQGAFVMRFR